LAAPVPEILRVIGEESEKNGTSTLTSRQIDQIIKMARGQKKEAINAFFSFYSSSAAILFRNNYF
jgi:hypothetical protein